MVLAGLEKKKLVEQFSSPWEQLWSSESEAFYWHNKILGNAVWEKPSVPYRPMIKTRKFKLIQAWPHLDISKISTKVGVIRKCTKCKMEMATRLCIGCAGEKAFCFLCFVAVHDNDEDLRGHEYNHIQIPRPGILRCCICKDFSVRKCLGLVIPQKTRQVIEDLAKDSDKENEIPSKEEFVKIVTRSLGIYMTKERAMSLYKSYRVNTAEKQSYSQSIWKYFLSATEDFRKECSENYCIKCWDIHHSKGTRSKHEWRGYKANAIVCIECCLAPASIYCSMCMDELCEDCSERIHSRGNRRSHSLIQIKEVLGSSEVYCGDCKRQAGTNQCQMCSESLCDSCNQFSHGTKCKVRVKLSGKDNDPIECSVCGKPPDIKCEQCGDVFCSERWTGNPGCFPNTHMKGNRKNHTTVPYDKYWMRWKQYKVEEKKVQCEEESCKEQDRLRKLDCQAKHNARKIRALEEEAKIFEDATEEFLARQKEMHKSKKKVKKSWKDKAGAIVNKLQISR